MAAGGYKEFVAGETLDEDEINDFLMQGMLVFAGTAARGSAITAPVEGQFSFLADSDAVEFYDGTAWVELSTSPGAAVVSGTTGSPTLGTVTSGGTTYNVYQFTGDGSITFSDTGFVDVLVLGGGAGGAGTTGDQAAGGGGAGALIQQSDYYITAGTVTITVGAGGAGGGLGAFGSYGSSSRFVSLGSSSGGGGGKPTGQGLFGGSGGGNGHFGGANRGQPGVPAFGNQGGLGVDSGTVTQRGGGGGGGAGAAGQNAPVSNGGDGGAGLASDITGTSLFYAGGGGGGTRNTSAGNRGLGGSSIGGDGGANAAGTAASPANRGSGGGGGGGNNVGAAGSSGVVIVRVVV